MSSWRRIEASLSSTNGVTGITPALLITTSTEPSCRSASSRKWANESRSLTSSASPMLPPPRSAAAASASSKWRSPMATRQPLPTSARAVVLPIPLAPPVIATTLPLNCRRSFAIVLLLCCRDRSLGRRFVDGDHGGTAEADVVLQRGLGALHLAFVRGAAQLPGQFRALRQPGSAEWVSLRDQSTGGIDDRAAAAEGGRFRLDQLVCLALGCET